MTKKKNNNGLVNGLIGSMVTIALMGTLVLLRPDLAITLGEKVAEAEGTTVSTSTEEKKEASITEEKKEEKEEKIEKSSTTPSIQPGDPSEGITRESEDLTGTLKNRKLTIVFNKLSDLEKFDGENKKLFVSLDELNEFVEKKAVAKSIPVEEAYGSVSSSDPRRFVDGEGLPEIEDFKVSGNTLTIKFKEVPTKSFVVVDKNDTGDGIAWEGLQFYIAS